jgi:hypothetical protein
MFDENGEDFDPYDLLQQHETLIMSAHRNILQITEHLDTRTQFIVGLTNEFNHLVEMVNQQEKIIDQLHNRLRLLEVARQYENIDKNNNTLN